MNSECDNVVLVFVRFFFSLKHFSVVAHSCTQTKQVSTILQPGTALNVTLKANYTRMEAPYKARLFSFYADTNESMSRRIEAVVSMSTMTIYTIPILPADVSRYQPISLPNT